MLNYSKTSTEEPDVTTCMNTKSLHYDQDCDNEYGMNVPREDN